MNLINNADALLVLPVIYLSSVGYVVLSIAEFGAVVDARINRKANRDVPVSSI